MEVEKLFNAIKEETEKYVELFAIFSGDDPIMERMCSKIYGMQEAFSIVAGMSYTDYLINKFGT